MVENYIGIPYKTGGRDNNELDCWGLVLTIYKELYQINLPHYNNINTNLSLDEASNLLIATEIYNDFIEVDIAKEGDLILFNIYGNPLHIGMALDNKLMIHADRPTGSVIESFRSRKWQTRIYKIYRHKDKM